MKKATTAALVAAGILAAAGCSSSNGDGGTKSGGPQNAPTDAVLKVAHDYQEAANRLDWRTACKLSSAALRGGSVEKCVARNTPDATATTPESTSPSPSFTPPTYADGSTPQPIQSSTPSGPDRANMGRVTASDVVEVSAAEDHPAGYGVLVSYTVQWPGQAAETDRRALRLVKDGGAWVVDQHEDIQAGDMGHGSPVRTALSGG
ncbi:hypothetical protein AB0G54_36945 [Streptomyces yokosukanensis]|uniref:hypothetical protein n=1 Tax=Streptomyces yokosukanensis TaxID=67386 RepID=UPI003413A022